MRQIFLDTETTGLEPEQGHRIIEVGCVEMINRRLTGRHYHQYINPDREIDDGALSVHGITREFLADKPVFSSIAEEFLAFIKGGELIIHNAPFDVGFIDHELRLLQRAPINSIKQICSITDTLKMAREKHPGQKNNLDALCRRYEVDNSHRELHGALLDAEILSDVYLRMTGGQVGLALSEHSLENVVTNEAQGRAIIRRLPVGRPPLPVIAPTTAELETHEQQLQLIKTRGGGECIWLRGTDAG